MMTTTEYRLKIAEGKIEVLEARLTQKDQLLKVMHDRVQKIEALVRTVFAGGNTLVGESLVAKISPVATSEAQPAAAVPDIDTPVGETENVVRPSSNSPSMSNPAFMTVAGKHKRDPNTSIMTVPTAAAAAEKTPSSLKQSATATGPVRAVSHQIPPRNEDGRPAATSSSTTAVQPHPVSQGLPHRTNIIIIRNSSVNETQLRSISRDIQGISCIRNIPTPDGRVIFVMFRDVGDAAAVIDQREKTERILGSQVVVRYAYGGDAPRGWEDDLKEEIESLRMRKHKRTSRNKIKLDHARLNAQIGERTYKAL
ncbi:hypothetical protein HK102_005941 [Quaeritorhiza haematococci]|nr:hypothetical protein HK102_005941 [Quaeritorhiza haematococci]